MGLLNMDRYNVQAKQFGRVIDAGIVTAKDRDNAIQIFKKKRHLDGYPMYAQKIQSITKK